MYKSRESNINNPKGKRQNGSNRPNQRRQLSPQAQSRRTNGPVAAAAAYSRAQKTGVSKNMRPSMGGHDRIVHRELIASVAGSTAYHVKKYVCNPGNSETFPWLSVQAKQYEQYRFHKLDFEFITRTGTTTIGSVLLAPDYDPSDPPPASEAAQSTYQDCVEDVPWRDQMCRLRPKSMFPTGERKFIRDGNTIGDLKLYDAANLYVGTVDEVGSDNIGKLWVSYDVEFFVPQTLGVTTVAAERTTVFVGTPAQQYLSGVSENIEFPTGITNPLGITSPSAGVFQLPKGAYIINMKTDCVDTVNENLRVEARFQKNGASVPAYASVIDVAGVAGAIYGLYQQAYVTSLGTDQIQVNMILTGTTGVLSTVNSSIMITLA